MQKNVYGYQSAWMGRRNLTKIFLLMKLTALLLMAFVFDASARGFAQKISFSGKDVSIERVFLEIEKQTGYFFLYPQSALAKARPVTISAADVPLSEFLLRIFSNQSLTYSVSSKTITVVALTPAISFSDVYEDEMASPPLIIRVEDQSGKPLAGASISNKKSENLGVTGVDGTLSLKVSAGDVLVISYVGYDAKLLSVTAAMLSTKDASMGTTPIKIVLKPSFSELDETVIIGYGTTSKRLSTGNVSTVKSGDIQRQPVINPIEALQGNVPGMLIKQQNSLPGGRHEIQIRGVNSINQGNSPFFIIDGVPMSAENTLGNYFGISPFSLLNIADIERIEVLKDADATAIYGSRGANGVVLITTKKGIAGKMRADFDLQYGVSKINFKRDLLNTQQYLEMRREAFKNDGIEPDIDNAPDLQVWDTTRYTDWQRVLMNNTANRGNASVSLSGGSATTQFRLSGKYGFEKTVLPTDDGNRKINSFLNVNHKSVNGDIQISVTSAYTSDMNTLPSEYYSVAQNITLPPNAPPLYDSAGDLNWANDTWRNPLAILKTKYKGVMANWNNNLTASWRIFGQFRLKLNAGYNEMLHDEKVLTPKTAYAPGVLDGGAASFSHGKTTSWIIEPQLEFVKNFDRLRMEVLAGSTWQRRTSEYTTLSGDGILNDAMLDNISSATNLTSTNRFSEYKYNAVFGRISLDWMQKYIVNLTARRDASSRFGPENRYGNFAAVGAGWIFTNENFSKLFGSVLNFGKLRVSYGSAGNDQIGDYEYLDTYSPRGEYQNVIGYVPDRLFNPDYGWEVNRKMEFGLELGFFRELLLMNLSYYRNRSGNQLIGYSLPRTTGYSSITMNQEALVQNSGWELDATIRAVRTKSFQWTTRFNLTVPRNKLVAYPGLESSNRRNSFVIGWPLGSQKRYEYLGIDPLTGIYSYRDINDDGIISSPADLVDKKFRQTNYYGSVINTFTFRHLALDVQVYYVNQIGNTNFLIYLPGTMSNQGVEVLRRWQKPGDNTDMPAFTSSYSSPASVGFNNANRSNAGWINASFFRLRNLALRYTLPEKLLKPLRLSSSSVFVQGQNLLVFGPFSKADPENGNHNTIPPLTTFNFGFQFSF